MQIGRVVVGVLRCSVVVAVRVLALHQRLMHVVVMPVVMAMEVLVGHRIVAVRVPMTLGHVEVDAEREC